MIKALIILSKCAYQQVIAMKWNFCVRKVSFDQEISSSFTQRSNNEDKNT